MHKESPDIKQKYADISFYFELIVSCTTIYSVFKVLSRKKDLIFYPFDVLIIVEDGITHISDYLLYIEMGNLFYGHGIEKIILGTDVKSIGKYAFHCETSLITVEIKSGLEEIGDSCFWNCRSLKKIFLPDTIIKLGEGCFRECSQLEDVTLSKSLEEIPSSCFARCNSLKNINVPNGITIIKYSAFSGCSGLETINLPNTLTQIEWSSFSGCTRLTTINLPNSLTNIGSNAFSDCIKLNNVIVPEQVKSIEEVFIGCTSLSNITLAEGLENIRSAFQNCLRLQEITIPKSVIYLSDRDDSWFDAFLGCENLKKIKSYTCSYAKKYYDSLSEAQKNQIAFESIGEGTHEWMADKVTIKQPTCIEKGIKARKCNICDEVDEDTQEEIPAWGHDWNNGVITKEPTETEEGTKIYTCYNCGETKDEPIPKLSAIQFSNIGYGWNRYDSVWISCQVNQNVNYYGTYVNQGETVPEYDETHETQTSNTNKWIYASLSVPDAPVDIYIWAKDANGNTTYIKVTPYYGDRPEKPSNIVKVGDKITATIEGDTLTLSGSGRTYDYDYDIGGWYQGDRAKITNVVFEGDITYIGNGFFNYFRSIQEITLPEGIKEIGEGAFYECSSLKSVILP